MIYKGKIRRGLLGALWIATLLTFTIPTPEWFLTIQLSLTAFILLALLTTYTFSMREEGLAYRIQIGKRMHITYRFRHEDVKEIRLERFGATTTGAVLKMKKGFAIRLIAFDPSPIDVLTGYGEALGIPVYKTKEYLRLEKKNQAQQSTPLS